MCTSWEIERNEKKSFQLTCIDAWFIKMLPSAVTNTDVSGISGTPFLSHSIVGVGTPLGAEQRISARPPASTRTDVGGTENCFLISERK